MLGSLAPIYLLVKSPGAPASDTTTQRRNYERHWTPVHHDFVLDEIEPAVKRALSAGAQLEQSIATHTWGKLALRPIPLATASVSSNSSGEVRRDRRVATDEKRLPVHCLRPDFSSLKFVYVYRRSTSQGCLQLPC